MKSDSFSFTKLASLATAGVVVGAVAACGFFPTERGYRRGPGFDDTGEPVPAGDSPETTDGGGPPSSGTEGAEAQPPVLGLFAGPVQEPLFGSLLNAAGEAGIDEGQLALLRSLRDLIGNHSADVAAAHRQLELVVADGLRRGVLYEAAIEDSVVALVDASLDDVASQLETLEAFHSLLTRRERKRIVNALVNHLRRQGVLGPEGHDEPPEPGDDGGDDGGDDPGGDDGDVGDDPSSGETDGAQGDDSGAGVDGKSSDGDASPDDDDDGDEEAEEPPPWVNFPWPGFPWPDFPLPEDLPWGDAFLGPDGPQPSGGVDGPAKHRPDVHSPMALLRKAGVHPRHDQVLALRRVAQVLQRHAETDARRARAEERQRVKAMLRAFASDDFAPDVSAVEERVEERVRREVGRHLNWIRMLLDVLTLQQRTVLARFIEKHAGALVGGTGPHRPGEPIGDIPFPFPVPEPGDPDEPR